MDDGSKREDVGADTYNRRWDRPSALSDRITSVLACRIHKVDEQESTSRKPFKDSVVHRHINLSRSNALFPVHLHRDSLRTAGRTPDATWTVEGEARWMLSVRLREAWGIDLAGLEE
ncbi:hypothetical protein HPP92_016766 [Vanilla planifolia]|uniref:Uncharacterized protein n=1 Tax=Vanilla planifolia TaxID=51239 RepID=A0A835QFE7_VANPL|nr:hypothetical protein HPP92_016766 [Vanilla planifolia]